MGTIDEATIKAAVCRYGPGERFWRGRRAKIAHPIEWGLDPALIADGGCLPLRDGDYCITLKHLPMSLGDALSVCHELTHILLDDEHWPSLMCFPGASQNEVHMVAMLNALIDIEIDHRLRQLGFSGARLCTFDWVASQWRARFTPPAFAERLVKLAGTTGYSSAEQLLQLFKALIDVLCLHDSVYIYKDGRALVGRPA
jgi:hypothetical protein